LTLTLTVHRGTRQIGGSCIEIAHPDGDRLILDAGRPLDAPEGATGLLPASLDRSHPATVLISHPHQDHWGLVEELPPGWPIWTGTGSAKLITIGRAMVAPVLVCSAMMIFVSRPVSTNSRPSISVGSIS